MYSQQNSDLVGIPQATLQEWLLQAQTALNNLMTGQQIVQVQYGQGSGNRMVMYKPADMGALRGYITRTSYTFGNRKSKQIMDLLKKRDKYQSKKNMKQYHKIELRITNLITEMHHHCSTFLCKRYKNIIIPKLSVKSLVQQSYGKAYKKSLLRLSHGKFIDQLKAKAIIYNTNVFSEKDGVHERYSSRQCSSCLFINEKSSNELKQCKNCLLEIDRDVNGAKNIYFYNNHLI